MVSCQLCSSGTSCNPSRLHLPAVCKVSRLSFLIARPARGASNKLGHKACHCCSSGPGQPFGPGSAQPAAARYPPGSSFAAAEELLCKALPLQSQFDCMQLKAHQGVADLQQGEGTLKCYVCEIAQCKLAACERRVYTQGRRMRRNAAGRLTRCPLCLEVLPSGCRCKASPHAPLERNAASAEVPPWLISKTPPIAMVNVDPEVGAMSPRGAARVLVHTNGNITIHA